jgi:HPt (histidine-containing phosphotransfer) domain-containing protein
MTFNFEKKDTVESLPEQIRNHLSHYVQNRLDDFSKIKKDGFDYAYIRDYCHKVVGSARSYQLHQLEEITLVLQSLAREQEYEQIKELLIDYEQYLETLGKNYLD